VRILRWLDRHLTGREIESINGAMIDAIAEERQADGCSNATANRALALLRSILRHRRRDWEEWTDRVPAVRLQKEVSQITSYFLDTSLGSSPDDGQVCSEYDSCSS